MKTRDSLVHFRQAMSQKVAKWQLTLDAFPTLFERLDEMDLTPRFDAHDGGLNVSFTGDTEKLTQVWRELRIAGWSPMERPKEGKPNFATFWYHAERDRYSPFWLHFTSSVCQRVQVGTRTVEEPIYEVRCGDQTALGELLSSEEDPRYNQASE